MFVKKSFVNQMIRAVEGAETGGSSAPATDQQQAPAVPTAPVVTEQQEQPPAEKTERTEDPKARGSKDQVLADLARERDKRQASEAEKQALLDKIKELERAQMTEAERLEAERKDAEQKLQAKIAEYDERFAKMEREKTIAEAVAKYKIPAAMADRIQGATPEEMLADAAKLAAELGPYTGPADSSAGRGAQAPTPTDLGGAIAAHYTK